MLNQINIYSQKHLYRGDIESEREITQQVNSLISTNIGKHRIQKMKALQLDFFNEAIKRIYYNGDRERTHSEYYDLMEKLTDETEFYCDYCNFNQVDYTKGLIVITGHFGIAKTTKVSQKELIQRLKNEIKDVNWLQQISAPPNDEPFPLRKAAIFRTIFKALNRERVITREIHMWYPFPFDEIQKDCGVIGIYLDIANQYAAIERELNIFFSSAIATKKNPIVIISPEAGTTGKRTQNKDPYVLEKFRASFAIYSAKFHIPILPIVQVIGKKAEFRTKVLSPVEAPEGLDKPALERFVDSIRQDMQQEIDKLRKQL
jgi:hypothetical protein